MAAMEQGLYLRGLQPAVGITADQPGVMGVQ